MPADPTFIVESRLRRRQPDDRPTRTSDRQDAARAAREPSRREHCGAAPPFAEAAVPQRRARRGRRRHRVPVGAARRRDAHHVDADQHADQARRRASSTRTSPSTTTSAPTRRPPTPTARRSRRQARTPKREHTCRHAGLLTQEPEPVQADPAEPGPGADLRPEPQLRPGAEGRRTAARCDQFVQNTSVDTCTGDSYGAPGLTMDYYDGNTVTGLWNYAQHYAMSDNSFGTTFGPSTPGALNLISGQTHGVHAVDPETGQQRRPPTLRRGLAERQRRRHGHQRPRPGIRRLLGQEPHRRPTTWRC